MASKRTFGTSRDDYRTWASELDRQVSEVANGYRTFGTEFGRAAQERPVLDPHHMARDRVQTIVSALMRIPPVFYSTADGEPAAQHLPEVARAHREPLLALGPGDMLRLSSEWLAATESYVRAVRFFAPETAQLLELVHQARTAVDKAVAELADVAPLGRS
jgi:hypothetical protein